MGKEGNVEWQLAYMCEAIAEALRLPVQSPAGTIVSVRELMQIADGRYVCTICIRPKSDHHPNCTEDVWAEHERLKAELRERHGIGEIIE